VDQNLLELLLADPYFTMRAPKSTGVEYFNFYWLQGRLDARASNAVQASFRDIQATLSELTARSVATAVLHCGARELLVCGGGAHNLDLLKRLQRLLPGVPVSTTASRGIDPDLMEGILFAWLARERIAGRKQDTRRITGARDSVLLGEIFVRPETQDKAGQVPAGRSSRARMRPHALQPPCPHPSCTLPSTLSSQAAQSRQSLCRLHRQPLTRDAYTPATVSIR
jgi:hypothetical protein